MILDTQHTLKIIIVSFVFACSNSLSDDVEKGQTLAKSHLCFDCHGKSGNKFYVTGDPVPVIAEQSYEYLRKAMMDYKSGARSGTIMSQIMSARSDEEIDLFAKYYSAQERY